MQEHRRYGSQLLVLLVLFIISLYIVPISGKNDSGLIEVDVGVILDADHMVGKVIQTCISMALEDFYTLNQNHNTTRIVLHKRDSKGDVVEAASAEEKLISNLSRFVVSMWVFVVLVLTSSYTASLTSMLTVQKLKPSVTDIRDLIQSKEYVGYQQGSFVEGILKNKAFDTSKFKNYSTFEQYDEALSKGSKNGGVAAIIDELPYIRLFLSNTKYCAKYTMVGPIYKTAGFGFAFSKGSPLVPDVSRAVLNVTEQNVMTRIEEKWLGEGTTCAEQDGARVTSDSLTLDSFKGLFIVAAVASFSALILFLSIFLYENWDTLASNDSSIREKLIAMAKTFDEEKDNSSDASKRKPATSEGMAVPATAIADCPQSPATSDSQLAEWIFSHDEGFSTTETSTPIHETIEIVGSNEER